MYCKKFLALCAAAVLAVLALSTTALAAGPKVTVRVEATSRTLLPATAVRTQAGSITKGGTPAGTCPSSTAAGALDIATHHNWGGKYYASAQGIFVTSIFGVKPTGSFYWTVFVNNRSSSDGICKLKLHRGDQLLFAVTNGSLFPLVLTAPRHATTSRSFKVKASYYNAKGVVKPAAGVKIKGAVTNQAGVATITVRRAGKLELTASHTGYVRAAAVTVRVSR
jgi:hypothetical protein